MEWPASVARRVARITPRAILGSALAVFLVYAWPGFVGWDTRQHLIEARTGHFSDGHPPAIARLVRLLEVFITGPAALLVIQAVTLLVGLYLVLRSRLAPRVAAVVAGLIFLFPPISGVTALVAKDGLMAGFLMIGIGLLLDERRRHHQWALVFIALASLMRWNALAATFAPMLLLYRWRPTLAGLRRYAAAFGMWVAITGASYEANDLMATEHEHLWYWSYAYQDIAGTLEYVEPLDDTAMEQLFAGVPLRVHDHIWQRFHAVYFSANFYHLMRGEQRLLDPPDTDAQRAAIAATWKRLITEHPDAYLRYRWDNFRLLIRLDRPASFSNVYVWFTVIAAPETIAELGHDAWPSRIQGQLREAQVWFSLGPLYYLFAYFALCFVLLPFAQRLELALLLSAIGYELAWFFLAATTDVRYSHWMVMCSLLALVFTGARLRTRAGRRS